MVKTNVRLTAPGAAQHLIGRGGREPADVHGVELELAAPTAAGPQLRGADAAGPGADLVVEREQVGGHARDQGGPVGGDSLVLAGESGQRLVPCSLRGPRLGDELGPLALELGDL